MYITISKKCSRKDTMKKKKKGEKDRKIGNYLKYASNRKLVFQIYQEIR